MKKNWRLIETIRMYSQDIGMEFGIKNVSYWKWRAGKEKKRKKKNWQIGKSSERSKKKKDY